MRLLEPDVITVSPWSVYESIGSKLLGLSFSAGSPVSAVYPSANLAIYFPFVLRRPIVVAQLYWFNGAAVSGNVDCGIYGAGNVRLLSTGSTAQSGTSTLQIVDVTDTQIGPGLFRLGIAMDNTTGTLTSQATGLLGLLRSTGVTQQATAFALPATATPATATFDYLPIFGLTTGSVI